VKAAEAQAAAEPPQNERFSKAAAIQVETLSRQKPVTFDKKAFMAAVRQAIEAVTPRNLEEVENFKESGKVAQVKAQIGGLVAMHRSRPGILARVAGNKAGAMSKNETARAQVAARIEAIYTKTKGSSPVYSVTAAFPRMAGIATAQSRDRAQGSLALVPRRCRRPPRAAAQRIISHRVSRHSGDLLDVRENASSLRSLSDGPERSTVTGPHPA
jgi:hypothetical protein